jgi:hypothetical protein
LVASIIKILQKYVENIIGLYTAPLTDTAYNLIKPNILKLKESMSVRMDCVNKGRINALYYHELDRH